MMKQFAEGKKSAGRGKGWGNFGQDLP